MGGGSQFWLDILGSGLVVWLVNKAVSIWQNRRKLPTNAVSILQNSASTAVERTEKDNLRLRADNARLDEERRELDRRNDVLMDVIRDLLAYSKRQSVEIRRLGGVIEDPPPLPPEFSQPTGGDR